MHGIFKKISLQIHQITVTDSESGAFVSQRAIINMPGEQLILGLPGLTGQEPHVLGSLSVWSMVIWQVHMVLPSMAIQFPVLC
jgi:hypothetical protein